MKILQVSNRVPWPLNEGGTIGIYNFTKAFSEAGHEVYLYCLDAFKHHTDIAAAEKELSKYAKLLIHPIDTDLKVTEAFKNLFANSSYNVDRFENESFKVELSQLLDKFQFDVVQLEGTYAGPYVETIRSKHSGLLSLRMHNAEYEIWERLASSSKNPLKKEYLNLLSKRLKQYEKGLIQKVDALVPVTQNDLDKFTNWNSNVPSMVAPAGIDLNYWKFNPSHGIYNWYHLGSLEWHANKEAVQWFLQEIFPELSSKYEKLRFHIAGKGLKSDEFQTTEQIHVMDYVEDAIEFVQELDVCLVPLLSGSGIRLKILEAMAAGKLVISTTIGAQGIECKHKEHLLIANNLDEFKSAVEYMINEPSQIKEMVQNAKALIEHKYSISAVAEQLIEFYEECLK
ncbi:MAG: glycosyltransferase family 4 protein [Bacteroidia bacterium]